MKSLTGFDLWIILEEYRRDRIPVVQATRFMSPEPAANLAAFTNNSVYKKRGC